MTARSVAAILVLALGTAWAGKYDLHEHARNGDAPGIMGTATADTVNRYDKQGYTPLHLAAAHGRFDVIPLLIERGADVNRQHEEYGTSALHEVARSASRNREALRRTVSVLADAGADPATVDSLGEDVLAAAATVDNGTVVKALLDAYGDRVSTASRQSALAIARRRGAYEVINAIESRGTQSADGIEAGFLNAASTGNYGVLMEMLNQRVDVDVRSANGATALILAAENGHPDIVRTLTGAGANVDARQDDGQAALHLAARNGHTTSVEILLDNDADPNPVSAAFGTPVNRAAERELIHLVEYLLSRGARPRSVDRDDTTALGSGIAWLMYAEHHRERLSTSDWAAHRFESERLLRLARARLEAVRDNYMSLRRREQIANVITDVVASSIAISTVVGIQALQAQAVALSQRQVAQIAALQHSVSYVDYRARLADYERVLLQPDRAGSYQLDIDSTPFANTESDLGLAVIISEYDRRIALVDSLLAER